MVVCAREWRRGKKTQVSLNVRDLPQGIVSSSSSSSSSSSEDELAANGLNAPPAYPTVVQQARDNMRAFDNCVLLTRVGGFYEVGEKKKKEFYILIN